MTALYLCVGLFAVFALFFLAAYFVAKKDAELEDRM